MSHREEFKTTQEEMNEMEVFKVGGFDIWADTYLGETHWYNDNCYLIAAWDGRGNRFTYHDKGLPEYKALMKEVG